MSCKCEPTTVHTPDPCKTEGSYTHSNTMRLFTLRCGTWVYSGIMPMNSPPQRGMRIMWEDRAWTVEQATLVGSEPGIDKWEVMLIQAGPTYYGSNRQQPCDGSITTPVKGPCMPCPPATQPPIEPPGGDDHDSPCTDPWYNYPLPHNGHGGGGNNGGNYGGGNFPRPVEMGLGCGPHYECNSYPS